MIARYSVASHETVAGKETDRYGGKETDVFLLTLEAYKMPLREARRSSICGQASSVVADAAEKADAIRSLTVHVGEASCNDPW